MPPDTLRTGRLVLRPHRPDDVEASHAMWSDPEAVRFVRSPSSRAESEARLVGYRAMRAARGFGFWLVESRATGEFLGEIGFLEPDSAIEPPLDCDAEFSWVLPVSAWGRGIATEAAEAALAAADASPDLATLQVLIDFENVPSLRLAGKLGFEETGTVRRGDEALLVLTRRRA